VKQPEKAQSNHTFMENNLLYAEHPEITTVYFEPRKHQSPHTQFLHRSGLITLLNGAPLPERMGQVSATIARRVGWHAHDYEVYE
jgi:hypothetical protein